MLAFVGIDARTFLAGQPVLFAGVRGIVADLKRDLGQSAGNDKSLKLCCNVRAGGLGSMMFYVVRSRRKQKL